MSDPSLSFSPFLFTKANVHLIQLPLVEENAKVLEERGGAVRLGGHLQKLVNSRVLGLTVVMRLVENDEMMLKVLGTSQVISDIVIICPQKRLS